MGNGEIIKVQEKKCLGVMIQDSQQLDIHKKKTLTCEEMLKEIDMPVLWYRVGEIEKESRKCLLHTQGHRKKKTRKGRMMFE